MLRYSAAIDHCTVAPVGVAVHVAYRHSYSKLYETYIASQSNLDVNEGQTA